MWEHCHFCSQGVECNNAPLAGNASRTPIIGFSIDSLLGWHDWPVGFMACLGGQLEHWIVRFLYCTLKRERSGWFQKELVPTGNGTERRQSMYTGVAPLTPSWDINLSLCLSEVNIPLQLPVWETYLPENPDVEFKDYTLKGIWHEFKVGYDYQQHERHPIA